MNKEIHIAVCDDDEIVCEAICARITKFMSGCDITAVCDKYTSPEFLRKNITSNARKYDVVFLDIDMPKLDGVALGHDIRRSGKPIDIVFVSNREDKVFDTFAVRPFGFIRKNNFTHDLHDTLRSYIKMRIEDDSFVAFMTNNNSVTRSVRVSDIVYIESFRYKQYVYMSDGEKIEIRMTMKELEEKLAPFDIVRVYQGYIVNFRYIQRIERNRLVLNYNGETPISISREKTQELKARYLTYLRKMGAVLFDGEE